MIGLQGKRIWAVCAVAILAGLWAPMAGGEAIYGTFTGYVTGGYDVYDEYGNKIEQYYDNAFLAALGRTRFSAAERAAGEAGQPVARWL